MDLLPADEYYNWLWQQYLLHPTHPSAPPELGPIDFHRLQLEHWLYSQHVAGLITSPVVEVGAEWRHPYLPPDAILLNSHDYSTDYVTMRSDVLGSATALPFKDNSLSTLICCETLEHVPNLFRAVSELRRVVRPGGHLFLTTPYFWPTHGNSQFRDYWRITRQGYEFLLAGWNDVTIKPTVLRDDSQAALSTVYRMEVFNTDGELPTGYMVSARKP